MYSPGLLAFRSETHIRSLPSGENMGKLLKWPFNGDLLQRRAVVVYQIQVKRWAALRPFDRLRAQGRLFCLCGPTRREDDPVAVGMEKRGEVGSAVPGHLLFAGPVGVHDEQFQVT